MNHIYIVLTRTRTNLSKFIRFFTKKPYNHISLALDKELYELYSFGRRRPKNPFIAGFVKEDIDHGFYHYFNDTTCVVYEVPVTERQLKNLKQYLLPFQADPLQYGFNFAGLIACGLHLPLDRKKHYFCSQFVSEALSKSEIMTFNRDCRLIQPADYLDLLDQYKIVYQGKITEYPRQQDNIETEPSRILSGAK